MKSLSLEVRVGLLVMVSLVILGGFLFVLGGIRFDKGYAVYVDFNNPGGLKPGAAVRVAGVRVGSVEQSTYLGGKLDPRTGKRPLVRIEVKLDESVRHSLHEDALFYVTSQGVLGEPYVAIDPGSANRPVLSEGTILNGVDPPRLDLALAMGYELLETMVSALRENRGELEGLLSNANGALKGMNTLLGENHDRINRILENLETATGESTALIQTVRQTYVDGPVPQRVLANLDKTLAATGSQAGPLMQELASAASDLREVLGPEERASLKNTIRDAATLASKAKTTLSEAQQVMSHIKHGQGTVGALVMDETVYDDMQEMLRDLKHNPWKLFWRE